MCQISWIVGHSNDSDRVTQKKQRRLHRSTQPGTGTKSQPFDREITRPGVILRKGSPPFVKGGGGVAAQSVEHMTSDEEVLGLLPAVATRSLLVGSVSVHV